MTPEIEVSFIFRDKLGVFDLKSKMIAVDCHVLPWDQAGPALQSAIFDAVLFALQEQTSFYFPYDTKEDQYVH